MNTLEKRSNHIFYIYIAVVIFFTTNDLAFGFAGQSIPAAICSIVSAVFVFLGYFKIKRKQTTQDVKDLTKFIKGNFDLWQIVLSVLDVICSAVVVFTSISVIGMVFRSVILFKVLFTPTKIITLSNKFKTVTKPFLIFCFIWVYERTKTKMKENKMSNIKLSLAQKIFIVVAFVLGIAYTLVSTLWLPQIAIFDDIIAQVATSIGGTAGIIFGAFLKGKEMSAEEIAKRDEKIQKKEKAKQEKLNAKAELIAEKQHEAEVAEAKALVAKMKEEEEAKKAEEEKKARLLKLAEEIQAQEAAEKAKAEVEADRPANE